MNVKVKICGITRIDDARRAIALGAGALGFILAPSARRVSLPRAEQLACQLPAAVLRFAVLRDPSFEDVAAALQSGALNALQLHGRETSGFVASVRRAFPHAFLLKRFGLGDAIPPTDYPCDAILLEPHDKREPLVADRIPAGPFPKPLFLAGKVGAGGVAALVRQVRPAWVDLCSSVEERPGEKSPEKLAAFFGELREMLL